MKPAAIDDLRSVYSPAVSPDGRWVAYVLTRVDSAANRYRSSVWLVAADGSAPARQLTSGESSDSHPVWSPDGAVLAFTSSKGEGPDTRWTLDVLPVGGPGERVTVATSDESIESPTWSRDGRRLAYSSRVRGDRYDAQDDREREPLRVDRLFSRVDSVGWTIDRPAQVFVVPADGGDAPRQVTEGPHDHGSPTWSPDGQQLAVIAQREPDSDLDVVNDIYLVDAVSLEPGEPRRLTEGDAYWECLSWSPEDDRIAALRLDEGIGYWHAQVAVVSAATGEVRLLTRELDRTCAPYPGAQPPVWHEGELLFAVEDHGAVHVYRAHADGRVHRVVGGDRAVAGYDAASGTLAFVVGTTTSPTELSSLVDGVEHRLTHHQDGFLAAHPALEPEHFTVPSSDGCDVDAWLIRPAGFADGGSYPVLLNVHGGPHTQYGLRWFDEFQMYAGAGFAVLYCNPHGSTGGTEHFARSIISPKSPIDPGTGWGGIDYDDVMAVLDSALQRFPFLDAGRVGIMGGSYGGYLTSWAIGHTDRFAAACSERACNNLASLEWSSDAAGFFRFEMGVSHLDDPDEYARMSPITYVKDIRTPVLILHSENDLRCPIEQADCLYVALRLLRREVDYYRFPAESHELTRGGSPAHRKQRAELIIDWFGQRLLSPASRERHADLAHDPERLEDPIRH